MANGVRLKSYIDAVNAERRHTDNMRAMAIVFGFGALWFGMQQAVKVYSATANQLLSLHNDLIRKGERDHAEVKRDMATKAEVEPLKSFVDNERGGSTMSGKFWGVFAVVTPIAVAVGFGLATILGAG